MSNQKGHPSRGISVYSYNALLGRTMTLEDVFEEMYDTGATCFEFLTSYIDNYPNPSPQWVDKYWGLCDKYGLRPSELGHWCENHLHRGPKMTDDEIVEELKADFRVANLLGFKYLRTKITCTNVMCDPEPGWQSFIEKALPYAEKYDVIMQNEVHLPTTLHTPHIHDEYLDFIHRTGTSHFGFNIDFGTFQTKHADKVMVDMGDYSDPTKPEEIIDFLPYTYACHAKFTNVNENFEETTIPYAEVIQHMVNHGWNGDLLSEYEGYLNFLTYEGDLSIDKTKTHDSFETIMDGVPEQIRRHQIMLRNLLGY